MIIKIKNNLYESAKSVLSPSRAEYIVQAFMVAFSNNPDLQKCELVSLKTAFMHCAMLDLIPNSTAQEAFILPYHDYKTKQIHAQFQLGYQGLCKLFYDSQLVQYIGTELVHADDNFKEIKGSERKLIHEPKGTGEVIGVYAYGIVNNVYIWRYMTADDIAKYKKKSKSGDSKYSPWNPENDPSLWMWRKTALKQLGKTLPKTQKITQAIAIDTQEDLAEHDQIATVQEKKKAMTAPSQGFLE
jgi:recombination protein RecT